MSETHRPHGEQDPENRPENEGMGGQEMGDEGGVEGGESLEPGSLERAGKLVALIETEGVPQNISDLVKEVVRHYITNREQEALDDLDTADFFILLNQIRQHVMNQGSKAELALQRINLQLILLKKYFSEEVKESIALLEPREDLVAEQRVEQSTPQEVLENTSEEGGVGQVVGAREGEQSFEEIKLWIKRQLESLGEIFKDGRLFSITGESDQLAERYFVIEGRLEKYKEANPSIDVKEVEVELAKHKYEAYWYTILKMIDNATNIPKNSSVLSAERSNVYSKIYAVMRELTERIRSELSSPEEARELQNRLRDLEQRVDAFSMLLFSTNTTTESIVGSGPLRKAPSGLNPDNFPLDDVGAGPSLDLLISTEFQGGEFEGGYNPVLDPQKKIEFDDFFNSGNETPFAYQETAVSWCMNLIRQIFDGSVPEAVNSGGEMISTSNLHFSEGSLIDFVYEQLVEYMREKNLEDKIPMVSKTLVKRAYQLVPLITGDHCFLASNSVMGMSDQIYYAYHLLEHLSKYESQGRTDADLLPVYMITTDNPNYSPIRDAYGRKRILAIENKLRSIGAYSPSERVQKELFETFGWTRTTFLLESLLFIPNVARGKKPRVENDPEDNDTPKYVKSSSPTIEFTENRDEAELIPRIVTPFLVSPLRSLPAKVNRRAFEHGRLDLGGEKRDRKEVKMHGLSDTDQSNPTITLDDLQDVETGSIPFSAINWTDYDQKFREYWDNLAQNGKWLIDLLMGSEEEFVEKMGNLSNLGGQENKIYYAATLLVKAAPEIATGRRIIRYDRQTDGKNWECPWGTFVMNGIVSRLILARVMLLAEKTGKDIDAADKEIDEFLNSIAQEKLFAQLGPEATELLLDSIRAIAKTGRGWRRTGMKVGTKFRQQVEDVFKVT
jgi:hypothetical protein